MYVCLCKGITDSHIKEAIFGGASSVREVRLQLGVMTQCGKCGTMTKKIFDDTHPNTQANNDADLYYSAL